MRGLSIQPSNEPDLALQSPQNISEGSIIGRPSNLRADLGNKMLCKLGAHKSAENLISKLRLNGCFSLIWHNL